MLPPSTEKYAAFAGMLSVNNCVPGLVKRNKSKTSGWEPYGTRPIAWVNS